MISITKISVFQDAHSRIVRCSVEADGLPAELVFDGWSSRPLEFRPITFEWLPIALLYPAMAAGVSLKIDASVSSLLLHNLNHDIQSLLCTFNPNLTKIKVIAQPLDVTPTERPLVATGFSAGVDSFYTLAKFSAPDIPNSLRINCLTTFDVGAMGTANASANLFKKYSDRLINFSKERGLAAITLRTNLAEFYVSPTASFQMTHIIRNVSAAMFFNDIIGTYLYSSSYPYKDINKDNHDMSFIEPILLPLLSTETTRFVSAGAGLSRIEKMERVCNLPEAKEMLDVCVASPEKRAHPEFRNCSRCWKCTRAMVTLDVLGKLDEFRAVFDVDMYRSDKPAFINRVVRRAVRGKPAEKDLVALMKSKGFEGKLLAKAERKIKLYALRKRLAELIS